MAEESQGRVVRAVHGRRETQPDPDFEIGLSQWLKATYGTAGLVEQYDRYASGDGPLDSMMRRCIWRAVAKRCGHGLQVGSGVGFKHLETFEIGDSVFIGAQAYIQGRFDGTTVIGNHVWIGPQAYLDARDLIIEDYVGWGPGAKVLGSRHTCEPVDVPIIHTDLWIAPVRIREWADVGTNATILPGVTIGRGALVGAGAVVKQGYVVEPYSIVGGVPAELIKMRPGAPGSDEQKHSR